MAISGMLPDAESEPGLIEGNIGFLIFGMVNMLLITVLILSSRWNGWKLALVLGTAYYGAVTFLIQIEAWYFMSNITFATTRSALTTLSKKVRGTRYFREETLPAGTL